MSPAAAANPSTVFLVAEAAAWALTVAATIGYLLVRRHRTNQRIRRSMPAMWAWSEPARRTRPKLFDQDAI